jgi:hypothetical protein
MPSEVKQVFSGELFNVGEKGPSFEHMAITENINKVKQIHKKLGDKLLPLKERQDLVALHHKCMKEINTMIDAEGKLDSDLFEKMLTDIQSDLDFKMASEKASLESQLTGLDGVIGDKVDEKRKRLQDMLDNLTEKYKPSNDFVKDTLKMGTDIRKGVKNFTKEQKDRLVGNIKMATDDLNTVVDMMLQEVSRLNNEMYESYQNARLMLKTIHDTYMSIIQKWKS